MTYSESMTDRLEQFAAAIDARDDVIVRESIGYVRVDVSHGYPAGEVDGGSVAISDQSDPVGEAAHDARLTIVRSSPIHDHGRTGLWFVPVEVAAADGADK